MLVLGGGLAGTGSHSDPPFIPAYRGTLETGGFKSRIRELFNLYKSCRLCPRISEINRLRGERDVCEAGPRVKVAAAYPHYGEEKCLVGRHGSGTIFFSHCSLRCVFCINHEISWDGAGNVLSDYDLAGIMIKLQRLGCRNINLVTPTHFLPNIVQAVHLAARRGLRIPLVYNSSGYERVKVLKLLEGIVDIYMPDLKFVDPSISEQYCSGAGDYFHHASRAILEMQRQVGTLALDSAGNARRGVIIRHLVMPNNRSNTDRVVRWIAQNLPAETFVNLMPQYRPAFRAAEFPEINRRLTMGEYRQALSWAREAGLTCGQ